MIEGKRRADPVFDSGGATISSLACVSKHAELTGTIASGHCTNDIDIQRRRCVCWRRATEKQSTVTASPGLLTVSQPSRLQEACVTVHLPVPARSQPLLEATSRLGRGLRLHLWLCSCQCLPTLGLSYGYDVRVDVEAVRAPNQEGVVKDARVVRISLCVMWWRLCPCGACPSRRSATAVSNCSRPLS